MTRWNPTPLPGTLQGLPTFTPTTTPEPTPPPPRTRRGTTYPFPIINPESIATKPAPFSGPAWTPTPAAPVSQLPAGFVVPAGAPPPPDPNNPIYKMNPSAYQADYLDWIDIVIGLGGGPPEEPDAATGASAAASAATAANQRMQTYLSAVIDGLGTEIDARRLKSDQAMDEFNRQLDAVSKAGEQFKGIQEFTIPAGSKYVPGFEPGGLATQLGLKEFAASPISYDPFAIALDLINKTPSPYDVGAPDTSQIQQAIDLAKRFL